MADTLHRDIQEQNVTSSAPVQRDLSIDQLDYMADLIAEFREMSSRAGMTTLAGILALAQSEAALQLKSRRKL